MKKIIVFVMVLVTLSAVHASLDLVSVYTDPAVISAGDEVDLVVQYRASQFGTNDARIGDSSYTFVVMLEGKSSAALDYITILDTYGQNVQGSTVFTSEIYNKKFRFRVSPDAPIGTYILKLSGEWYRNGVPSQFVTSVDIPIHVRREGIIVDVAGLTTEPARIRPGTNFVTLSGLVHNAGVKDARAVSMTVSLPEGFQSSFSHNDAIFVGDVSSSSHTPFTAHIDVLPTTPAGVYTIGYTINYRDEFGQSFTREREHSIVVKPRPYLEVVSTEGVLVKNSRETVMIEIKNTGESLAENVDVRILKNNAQPFEIEIRSDYIGNIAPGETAIAIFDIKTLRLAGIRDHNFELRIRAKGESEDGDDSIYIFSRDATFEVQEGNTPVLLYIGIVLLVVLILFIGFSAVRK